jgi:predicted transcriptional regulator
MVEEKIDASDLVEFTTQIVSAYVSNNAVAVADLHNLIGDVNEALARASGNLSQPVREELKPVVPARNR